MARKVLFVIESLAGGGAEKVLTTLVKHLDKKKFEVTLCCISNVGPYVEEVKPYVKYHYILPDPSGLSGLPYLLYKIKYKLVYSWLPTSWVYRLFIPKGNNMEIAFIEGNATRILSGSNNTKARKIAWVHTDVSINKGKLLSWYYYRRFDQIVTVSQTSKKAFEELFPDVDHSVITLYNPIDSNSILRGSADNLDIIDRDKGIFRLISVGRLVPIKAYDRLLRVVLRLHQEMIPVNLWIIGEGPIRKRLTSFIKSNGMDSYVHLWGFDDNPYKYMSRCDLFVCSSLAEGFSTAATEALVLGIPVVTTMCSGMKELLGEEDCGLIVDNDEDSLYCGLKSVLKDSEHLEKMKVAAKNRGTLFTLETLMPPIESFLGQEQV